MNRRERKTTWIDMAEYIGSESWGGRWPNLSLSWLQILYKSRSRPFFFSCAVVLIKVASRWFKCIISGSRSRYFEEHRHLTFLDGGSMEILEIWFLISVIYLFSGLSSRKILCPETKVFLLMWWRCLQPGTGPFRPANTSSSLNPSSACTLTNEYSRMGHMTCAGVGMADILFSKILAFNIYICFFQAKNVCFVWYFSAAGCTTHSQRIW